MPKYLSVCAYVCVSMHTYVCACACLCVCEHAHLCVCLYMCVWVCVLLCVPLWEHERLGVLYVCLWVCVCTYMLALCSFITVVDSCVYHSRQVPEEPPDHNDPFIDTPISSP